MRLYFGGTEVKMWRDLLTEQKVPDVALSYIGLLRRNKGNVNITNTWSISEHYDRSHHIFLDSGAYTLNKEGSEYTREQAEELAADYMTFVSFNKDSVDLISEFDAQILGYDYIKMMRDAFYDDLPPDKFMPIWHAEYGLEELERLCSAYSIVGITSTDMGDKSLIPTLNGYVQRYGVRLHGVAITGRKLLLEVRWDSVASMSWLSPSRFGDTIVWTGSELKRYPKDYKDRARKQHSGYLRNQGFDIDKIQADDSREILKLSLWSWGKYIEYLDRHGVTNVPRNETPVFAESSGVAVATQGGQERNEHLLPAVPETDTFEAVVRQQSVAVRPPESKKALHSALIDLQAQRVAALKRIEDQEGGYADINLSSEIDRLNRLIKTGNEMEKQSFSLKIEASAPSGEGFMSTMFGSNVGEKLTSPATKVVAEQIVETEEIHEAELVDE